MSVSFILGGDTVPTEPNFAAFAAGDTEYLFGKALSATIADADFRFFNLEVPLTDTPRPIPKCGPNLIAPSDTVAGVRALNALIGLANNHTRDQDDQGLFDTFAMLDKYDIPHIGAGSNLAEAAKPYIFEKDGVKIGVYACAEHEFTIAGEHSAGANPYEIESLAHVQVLKAQCDYVVVVYHGGKEHFRYGSPRVQQTCHRLISAGADVVTCQHSHCVGAMENYRDGLIVYGQGNFLFDWLDNECWQTGILLKLVFDNGVQAEYIPLVHPVGSGKVRLAEGTEKEEILNGFFERSKVMLDPAALQAVYEPYAMGSVKDFFFTATPDKDQVPYGDFQIGEYSKQSLLKLYNLIRCEAHNEVLNTAISKMIRDAK